MTENGQISLDSLPIGGQARLAAIDLPPAESQRLMEMGMTIGTSVRLVKLAPLGDPMEIRVRGSLLSIRKSTAARIRVRLEPGSVR